MIPYSLFYEQVRDEMFVCLNKQLKVIALIEKLRQDRLDTHGEKELKRRVQVQQKIVNMKAEENRRRDEGEFSRVIFFMKFFLWNFFYEIFFREMFQKKKNKNKNKKKH